MKLVDILARELKVWPEDMEAAYSSGHLVRFCTELGTSHVNVLDIGQEPVDQASTLVTRFEWQAAVDALNAPKVVEWAKGSLPPIGSVVEWDGCTFAAEDPQEKDLHVGDQVTIIAHLKDGDFEIAAFTFNPSIHNAARGSVWVNQGARGCFRPRRTADQVAAEEREKAIKEMMQHGVDAGDSTIEYSCAAIYDAGYRKEPKPCGS